MEVAILYHGRVTTRWRTLIVLFLVLVGARLAGAQSHDRLVDLRVTGTLLPLEEASRDALFTVPIVVQDTSLLLRIGRVEELTAPDRAQVREAVVWRQVRFNGPAALLARLPQPELRGRVLTSQGLLEPQARAVKEAPSVTPPQGNEETVPLPVGLLF